MASHMVVKAATKPLQQMKLGKTIYPAMVKSKRYHIPVWKWMSSEENESSICTEKVP